MTDYTKLVKALRHCVSDEKGVTKCAGCPYYPDITGCMDRLHTDAAAAIEALQAEVELLKAENPIVETVLVDKMRQQMEETVCHCNVKENAELIAKILDDDVDRKVFELPKQGEWVEDTTTYAGPGLSNYKCSLCGKICGTWRRGLKPSELPNWCGNCGADMRKMEVQE